MPNAEVQDAPAKTETSSFPRLTRGRFSGAVFLMKTETEGVAITNGTDCFMQEGTTVSSMDGMLPHDDAELLQRAIAGSL